MVLSGIVPTCYLKQVAQAVAGATNGVMQVENRVEIRSEA
jgi:osmotically-inducible protein OsmY